MAKRFVGVAALAVAVVLAHAAPPVAAETADPGTATVDGPPMVLTPRTAPTPGPVAATATAPPARAESIPPNEDFVFRYDTAVDSATRQVFEAAGGIWSGVLEVEVPVQVSVSIESLPPGILGGASPIDFYADDPSFPVPRVWLPGALANQFAGADLGPGEVEISIEVSESEDFYRGLDGSVPPDQISLLSLAIHELAHGLGHYSFAPLAHASRTSLRLEGYPLVYDQLLVRADGGGATTRLVDLTAQQLGPALTGDVRFSGSEAFVANGGRMPVIYAPDTFEPGSSTSHLDQLTHAGQLMGPGISPGQAVTSVPALTRAMFADLLWGLEVTTPDQAFVTALAREFVRHFPTPSDLAEDLASLGSGQQARRRLAEEFGYSDLYVGQLVDGFYLSTLGRPADPGGFRTWVDAILGGSTSAEVAAKIYASAEYFARSGGTNRAWTRDLYRELLEREPDQAGLANWTAALDAGASRTAIALDFYQSLESRRTRVANLYLHLLGRRPDPGGLATWTTELRHGNDVDLAVALAGSAEYYQRASSRYAG